MTIPGWILSVILFMYLFILIYTHRNIQLHYKIAMIIPAIGLSIIYLSFALYNLDIEFRQNTSRVSLIILFLWHTIILWLTRKSHIKR